MRTYICIITSNNSNGREYEVNTSSARKAAQTYGRCEGGEKVTILNKSRSRIVSQVIWTPEGGVGGKYIPTWYDPKDPAFVEVI